jgi:hypothetical protein
VAQVGPCIISGSGCKPDDVNRERSLLLCIPLSSPTSVHFLLSTTFYTSTHHSPHPNRKEP